MIEKIKMITCFVLALIFASINPVLAADQPDNVGPQGIIGVQGEIGPQGPVGVVEPIGPHGITPDNSANINNDLSLNVNTGGNSIGQNTATGNINTGDITGAVNLINVSNSQFAPGSSVGSQLINPNINQITLTPSINRTTLKNTNTGQSSINLNSINNPNIISILDLNNITDNNGIEILANTGKNNFFSNTKAGNLTTGDINLGINLINIANLLMPNTLLSADIFNISGSYNGDIIIPELANSTTGSDSDNQNILTSSNIVGVNVLQNANVDNNTNIITNTGGNTIRDNSVIGDTSTGGSVIKNALINIANIAAVPIFYLINVFGQWDGSLFGLDPSRVVVNEINNLDVTRQNEANINNNISINANTGDNLVNDNTVIGNIKTGSIKIASNVINVLNSMSDKVGQFALRLVNIFGDWHGNANSAESKTASGKNQNNSIISSVNISSTLTSNESTKSNIHMSSQRPKATTAKTLEAKTAAVTQNENNNPPTNTAAVKNQNFPWKLILIILAYFIFLSWAVIEIITIINRDQKAKIIKI